MKNADVLKALTAMSTKVPLHTLYDAGKAGRNSTSVDPKLLTTAGAIKAAGLSAFAQPVKEKCGHLMHDKFIERDGTSVWSGSGNFTNGGLLLQDNQFFTIDSPAIASAYSKTFGNLGSPGHSASHSAGVTSTPIQVKIGSISGCRGPSRDEGRDEKQDWFANGDSRFVAANSQAFNKTGDTNNFMHSKVIIVDDKIVITGSYNFSENAEANDENLLIFESTSLAKAYNQYFDALFAQYQKTGAKLPPVPPSSSRIYPEKEHRSCPFNWTNH
jgi:phosphatidylserine/phosphatidylglycerophosphate/cardiolipin synthase-like enzyme